MNQILASWQLNSMSVPQQFIAFADAYLDSAERLCKVLKISTRKANYERGAVVLYLTFHSVELFLNAAILAKSPNEKLHHNKEHYNNEYRDIIINNIIDDSPEEFDISDSDAENALNQIEKNYDKELEEKEKLNKKKFEVEVEEIKPDEWDLKTASKTDKKTNKVKTKKVPTEETIEYIRNEIEERGIDLQSFIERTEIKNMNAERLLNNIIRRIVNYNQTTPRKTRNQSINYILNKFGIDETLDKVNPESDISKIDPNKLEDAKEFIDSIKNQIKDESDIDNYVKDVADYSDLDNKDARKVLKHMFLQKNESMTFIGFLIND